MLVKQNEPRRIVQEVDDRRWNNFLDELTKTIQTPISENYFIRVLKENNPSLYTYYMTHKHVDDQQTG
jgi:hypothetical protein